MDRRNFFKMLGAGIAGIALKEAIRFGRVWSFPSNIVVRPRLLTTEDITLETLRILKENLYWSLDGGSSWQSSMDLENSIMLGDIEQLRAHPAGRR
jgi:hypothetical protein